jgi:hypothetical protein
MRIPSFPRIRVPIRRVIVIAIGPRCIFIINDMLFRGSSAVTSDFREVTEVDATVGIGVGGSWLGDVLELDILNTSAVVAFMIMGGGIPGLFKELFVLSFGLYVTVN